jgi:PAS domain S-box-containing protein
MNLVPDSPQKLYEQMASAFDALPGGIALLDADDRYVMWSQRYAEILGPVAQEIAVGLRFEDAVRATLDKGLIVEAIGREDEWLADSLTQHRLASSMGEHHLQDGTWIRIQEYRTADGGRIVVRTDITELKRDEGRLTAAIQESKDREGRISAVVDTVLDGIITIDADGTIETFNAAATRIFGYSADEAMGQNVKFLMPEPFHTEHDGYLKHFHETGETKIIGIGREVIGRRKDGSTFPMSLSVSEMHVGGQKMFTGIVRDITELKEAEAKLKAAIQESKDTEGRISAVVDNVLDGIITIDADGTIETFNAAATRIFGYSVEEAMGQNVKFLMPEPFHTEHDGYLKHFHETGETKIIGIGREVVGRRKDGSTFPMSLAVGEMHVGGQKMFTGIVRDITELKEVEAELSKQKLLLDSAVDNMAQGLLMFDADARIVFWNQRYLDIYGMSPSVFKEGCTLFELMKHREDLGAISGDAESNIERVFANLAEGKPWSIVQTFSDDRSIHIRVRPMPDGGWVSTHEDVTENAKFQAELKRSNADLEQLNYAMEKLSAGYSLWDKDDRFVACNAFFRKYRGEAARMLTPGMKHEEYMREVAKGESLVLDKTSEEEWLQRHLDRKSLEYREHEDVQRDGRVFRVTTQKLPSGGIISFHFDITENAKFREDLKRSNTDLEQFAYVASHDLQEPLRMVASYTELLAKRYEGQLDDRADRYIGHAVSGAKRMQSLLNDLLAYSRAGQSDKSMSPTDTMKVVANVGKNLAAAIESTGAELVYDNLPAVLSEPVQLAQIFQNLIANAIKFHGDESPRIEITAKTNGAECIFLVADNGIGIDVDHFDRIFTIFQRLHERGTYEGIGLGLAIVKKLVERHGGAITVESEPGRGATFIFTLPKATTPLGESL